MVYDRVTLHPLASEYAESSLPVECFHPAHKKEEKTRTPLVPTR